MSDCVGHLAPGRSKLWSAALAEYMAWHGICTYVCLYKGVRTTLVHLRRYTCGNELGAPPALRGALHDGGAAFLGHPRLGAARVESDPEQVVKHCSSYVYLAFSASPHLTSTNSTKFTQLPLLWS